MRKLLITLCLTLSAALTLVSCLSDDTSEVTLYNDSAITSFAVSTAPLFIHTTSSKGEDSVYVTHGNSMTAYTFTIDHINRQIFNEDSLPKNVDATRLICNYSTKNNGVAYIQNIDNDSLKYFSTDDSLDFTKPRMVRVYALDGSGSRDYTIKVNVHQETPDSFNWQRGAYNTDLQNIKEVKAFALGNKVVVAGKLNSNTVVYVRDLSIQKTWIKVPKLFNAEAWKRMVVQQDALYILDNQKIYKSTTGTTFDVVKDYSVVDAAPTLPLPYPESLIGACSSELYGINADGSMMVSRDGGMTWTFDTLDEDASMLPSQDISYACQKFYDDLGCEYVLLVGNRNIVKYPNDKGAVVWRKIVDEGAEDKWAYVGGVDSELYLLPQMSAISVFVYNGTFLACGGPTINGDAVNYKNFYQSRDGGITWKKSSLLPFPTDFDTNATSIAATSDDDNFIYVVATGTGETWQGRMNMLGWEHQ